MDVSTVAELTAAISNAKAGDEIVLAAGVYSMSDVSCAANGTSTAPIVVRSATPLAARLELSGVEGFKVRGSHWHFEGLDIHGVCSSDDSCEHAFHVTGAATGFVMRDNRVVDFNAQLKVNAEVLGKGNGVIPHGGLVEYNELYDTHPRATAKPITKLNIDTGDDWTVRGNYVHDFHRASPGVTYGVFLKSGGKRGLVERNLVVCAKAVTSETATIGLSLGGGGTSADVCAPSFDSDVPCAVEHEDGTIRNNIVASCSDVGIYLNKAKNSHIFYNTLVATTGIDFRFSATSGEARGNVLSGQIRNRDAATGTFADNATLEASALEAMYVAPVTGDLRVEGDLAAVLGKGPDVASVTDDYCGRPRGAAPFDVGALESSLGDCATFPPPRPNAPSTDGGTSPGADGGGNGSASDGGGGPNGGVGTTDTDDASDDGCSCRTAPRRTTSIVGAWLVAAALALAAGRRGVGRSRGR